MSVIKNVVESPRSLCNKKQACQDLQRQKICISDADHDYTLDKIEQHDHIEYVIKIHNGDK